uniref:Uncharacterized protein n=1 Tax=Oryza sativa subsp. japonica TaxID=39947 RepID=Q5W6X2_ORYSJ|nr:hypothetical protein [Oryza sativa Japonica Group]
MLHGNAVYRCIYGRPLNTLRESITKSASGKVPTRIGLGRYYIVQGPMSPSPTWRPPDLRYKRDPPGDLRDRISEPRPQPQPTKSETIGDKSSDPRTSVPQYPLYPVYGYPPSTVAHQIRIIAAVTHGIGRLISWNPRRLRELACIVGVGQLSFAMIRRLARPRVPTNTRLTSLITDAYRIACTHEAQLSQRLHICMRTIYPAYIYKENIIQEQLSTRYIAISRTTISIVVREMILLARWFSNQYVAISRIANFHWCSRDDSTCSLVLEPWLSYDYYLVLDQRCSDSPITSTSTKLISEIPYHKRHLALKPILMSLYAVLIRPLRNLRELRLGTPRADKALSDPSEMKDHENSIRHYRRLHVSMVLYQDRLKRVRQVLTRLRRRLYAYSITQERLVDLDKEYEMKRWRDENAISDLAGHELEEEDYPIVDYESDLQTAMSTTVR